jgi:cold shock CspA family protein
LKAALTRIGVFYDGSFFQCVNDYYAYHHPRKARISLRGLHEFIRTRVAQEEHVEVRLCPLVEVHYFRGRFSAQEVQDAGRLFSERAFDDVLVREGVTTHYLPMGPEGTEKGIDVWFALEAYELARQQRFEVCVLIACDSDYVPLARKLNALGTRVMVVGWDFEYTDRSERSRINKTSRALLAEVMYPVLLSDVIDDATQSDVVQALFLPASPRSLPEGSSGATGTSAARPAERHAGTIQNLIEREADQQYFGFISPKTGGENLWFGERDLEGVAFSTLSRGDAVTFELSKNAQGACAKHVRRAD